MRTAPYARVKPGLGRIGIRRIDKVSARVRDLLLEVAPEIVLAAEDAFERVIFVPVSALGTSPQVDAATGLLKVPVARISPRWVTVPFVYTIARWSSHLISSDLDRLDPAFESAESAEEAAG